MRRVGALGGIQVRNIMTPGQSGTIAVFTNDDDFAFGKISQGAGLSHDLFCRVSGKRAEASRCEWKMRTCARARHKKRWRFAKLLPPGLRSLIARPRCDVSLTVTQDSPALRPAGSARSRQHSSSR